MAAINQSNTTEIAEDEKATCSVCGYTFHENDINMIDYEMDLCVLCELQFKAIY